MPKSGTAQAAPQDTPTEIFDSSEPGMGEVPELSVGHSGSSTATSLEVQVKPLHGSGEYFPLYPGASQTFRCKKGIKQVIVTARGNSAIVDWGITEDFEDER